MASNRPVYLLDTNVVSNPPGFGKTPLGMWLDRYATSSAISVITVAEVRRGLGHLEQKIGRITDQKARQREQSRLDRKLAWHVRMLEKFEARIEPIDLTIAQHWADMSVKFPALTDADKVIAATALARNLIVATRNIGDFKASGVPLVNPYDPATWPEEPVDDPLLRLLAP